ncbi:aconitase iron-sulfur domain-containing protein [Xylariaceae sp. FL1651]|nr:aconitase iron-sulfur domain-containing protein [Xylariaceae sp. FL1651]
MTMAKTVSVPTGSLESSSARNLFQAVSEARNIEFIPNINSGNDIATEPQTEQRSDRIFPSTDMLKQLGALATILLSSGFTPEAAVLREVYQIGVTPTDFGGLGLTTERTISPHEESELLFLTSAHLESLNSAERSRQPLSPLPTRPAGRRGMTLSEKIFAAHDVDRKGEVKAGDVIRVDVDWVLASELSWSGMKKAYDGLGQPGIFRNDRFWLAGDHIVDPRVMELPKIQSLVKASDWAKRKFKMTENQGMNYTIMHTEFCRQRAQPGMLCIGSDSHTCSAGSMSALAIGLGVADVTLPLVTGETWFRVPESVKIEFVGRPKVGIGGKDVILYILRQLKRNTVAADRIVEYTGPGLKYLSCDARFAIANMTTEFGGVSGIFTPDSITKEYIDKRKTPKHKSNSVYFRPDGDAEYAEAYTLDLSQVEPFVARYPRPDDVVPVTDMEGQKLDGCFIGACTTTEEDLVLAALVLEEGLNRGFTPVKHGKRKVVPGSKPIVHNLRAWGLEEVYQRAGFEIGAPGCSYCVGMSADKAAPGERWLSSQNRNFENRMGPGAIGSLASAITVAASSFNMEITNPAPLLDAIDTDRLDQILGRHARDDRRAEEPVYVEPGSATGEKVEETVHAPKKTEPTIEKGKEAAILPSTNSSHVVSGKVHILGDFIDTDALAPSEVITNVNITPEELGKFCLYHTHPDFWQRVNEKGHNIVVAGRAFGCGSSRESAVTALQGAGVRCVIARSFAFIYGRNQPNLGLLGFEMRDERFWEVVADGQGISIDLDALLVTIEVGNDGNAEGRHTEAFPFQLSLMQRRLMEVGGVTNAFSKWGKGLWHSLTVAEGAKSKPKKELLEEPLLEKDHTKSGMEW